MCTNWTNRQSKSKSKPYDPPASRTTATTTAAPARGGISARGPSTRGTGRGGRGGVAGARRESGGRGVGGGGGKEKKEPKTSSQLDDELEAFMRAPVTGGEKVTAAVVSCFTSFPFFFTFSCGGDLPEVLYYSMRIRVLISAVY